MRPLKRGLSASVSDPKTREALLQFEDALLSANDALARVGKGQLPTSGGGGGVIGVSDHGLLTGLGDDDHTQYLLLTGRGGQTITDNIALGGFNTLTFSHPTFSGIGILSPSSLGGVIITASASGVTTNTANLTVSTSGTTIFQTVGGLTYGPTISRQPVFSPTDLGTGILSQGGPNNSIAIIAGLNGLTGNILLNGQQHLITDQALGFSYTPDGFCNIVFNNDPFGIAGTTTATPVFTVRGCSGQTGDIQRWMNNSSTTLAKVDKDGNITAPSFNVTLGNTTVTLDSTGLLQTNSIGASTLNLVGDSYVKLQAGGTPTIVMVNADGSEPSMDVRNGVAGTVALKVRQAASQTADLLQFTGSNGTTLLSKVDKDGNITAPTITASTGFNGDGTAVTGITEAHIVRPTPPLLARLLSNETVGGNWYFDNANGGRALGVLSSGGLGADDGLGFAITDGTYWAKFVVDSGSATSDVELIVPTASARLIGATETLTVTNKTLAAGTKIRCGLSLADANAVTFVRGTATTVGIKLNLAANTTNIKDWTALNFYGTVPLVGDVTSATSGKLVKVDSGTQTADIGSTALTSTPGAGMYAIHYTLETVATDGAAGTVSVTFGWTGSAARTNTPAALNLAAAGEVNGTINVTVVSGDISYSTSHTGSYGTASYKLTVRVVALG